MRARSSPRSIWLSALFAVGLHAVAVGWWFSRSVGAARPALATVAPITVVWLDARKAAEPSLSPLPPAPDLATPRLPTRAVAPESKPMPMSDERQRSLDAPAPARNEPNNPAPAGAGEPEQFQQAYLAGEPLIKLGEDDSSINGRLALRLAIDDTGHVVDSHLNSREGLSDTAVATLVRSFTGYVYVPARRNGRPVHSEVTMVISVRDGQGASVQVP